ncbi:hypothetical protein Aduo_005467 [Ancylostoma duodenale]
MNVDALVLLRNGNVEFSGFHRSAYVYARTAILRKGHERELISPEPTYLFIDEEKPYSTEYAVVHAGWSFAAEAMDCGLYQLMANFLSASYELNRGTGSGVDDMPVPQRSKWASRGIGRQTSKKMGLKPDNMDAQRE